MSYIIIICNFVSISLVTYIIVVFILGKSLFCRLPVIFRSVRSNIDVCYNQPSYVRRVDVNRRDFKNSIDD